MLNLNWLYDDEKFLSESWCQKPVLFKNAIDLGELEFFNDHRFDKIVEKCRQENYPYFTEVPGQLQFVENIDRFDTEFLASSTRLAQYLKSPQVWFTAVRTFENREGLGSHFDLTDNFVVQISGEKTWTLMSPQRIPREELRARCLSNEFNGSYPMETADFSTVLRPGDILHIPRCWVHDGVSHGHSLSMSIVSGNTLTQRVSRNTLAKRKEASHEL